VTTKGIVLSLLGGMFMGFFYPFIAKAIKGEGHLGPYTVMFVFALGILLSNLPLNYTLMRRPLVGAPVSMANYFAGAGRLHFWGILGGAIWAMGALSNFVASYAAMVGPATSYALGQGATMVGAIWGVFVWKEFAGAGPRTNRLLAMMFAFFITGLICVALAPVVK
jgi:glucose uptake protein